MLSRAATFLNFLIFFIFLSPFVFAATPYWGSLHQHTGYSAGFGYDEDFFTTSDGCYFPLEGNDFGGRNVSSLANQAHGAGLAWLGFSDHSYCLNQSEFDRVKTDCQNARNGTFSCLVGEEISAAEIVPDEEIAFGCLPGDDGEAHMGGYGLNSLITQNPSNAHCPISPDVQAGINSIEGQNGLSVLNHPVDDLGLLWEFLDFESIGVVSNYDGIEIFNGEWDSNDQASRDIWKTFLLQGKKIFAYSGTDSHDEVEDTNYNVVYLTGSFNNTNIQSALESGYHSVSSNGEMYMEIKYNGNTYHMGDSFTVVKNDKVNISLVYDLDSSCSIRILKGELDYGVESPYNNYFSGQGSYNTSNAISGNSYFRAECFSGQKRIFTNPIWINVTTGSACSCGSWTSGSCSVGGCGANERQQTRTCSPSACSIETQCVPDVSCLGGSTLITVCASGCSYTTIQAAIDNSNPGDHINITDSRNYAENLVIDSGDAEWLECGAGANISRNSGTGIFVKNPSTVDDIYIKGCTIKNFGTGIWLNHTTNARIENNTFINVGTSIYLDDQSDTNKIINNTVSISQDYGVNLEGLTGFPGPSNNIIRDNKIYDSAVVGIWVDWGLNTQILSNYINGSDDSGDHGIEYNGHSSTSNSNIHNNTIYSNDKGYWNRNAPGNNIQSNIFCPLNTNGDIEINGAGLTGDYNTCDSPGVWNDSGTIGCSFSCDTSPNTNLVGPLNGTLVLRTPSNLTCSSEDSSQLANVTLYHNIGGVWHANQTKLITGTSNTTSFSLNNLVNGTSFIWNCRTSDNTGHTSFAVTNWTAIVSLTNRVPTTPNLLGCNEGLCISNGTFSSSINVSCFGSVDDDEDLINYSIEAFYNNSWKNIGNHTQAHSVTWNITTLSGQSNVSIRCRSIDPLGTATYSAYYAPSMNLTINPMAVSANDTNKFLILNSSNSTVAWLGDLGNIVLAGSCFTSSNCVAPNGSFIVGNRTDNSTAYISPTGNLCLESGSCSAFSATCNPTIDSFVIQNNLGVNMSYINGNGGLCYRGGLFQNATI